MTKDQHRAADAVRPSSLAGRWWVLGHFHLFGVLLSLWTWKLVVPHPVPEELRAGLGPGLALAAAKALHLGGYALLAFLAATLPAPRRWRVGLVLMLFAHGVATEVIQTYVPNRTGRAHDVLIDWNGVALGTVAAQLRGRRR